MSASRPSRAARSLIATAVVASSIVLAPFVSSPSAAAAGRLIAGEKQCFSGELPNGQLIPEGAKVTATVTGVQPDAIGFISLHRRDQAFDTTSSLNINPGLNLANTTSYTAGPNGEICITSSVATNAIVDVIGFDVNDDGTFVDERLYDSRKVARLAARGTQCFDGRLPSGATIPEEAKVTATVTGVQPDAIGFISLHRRDQAFDTTSSLNINPGLNLANTTSYTAGPNGEICITSSVATNATIDIISYDTVTESTAVDKRVYDTRTSFRLGSLLFPTSRQCFDAERTGVAIPPEALVTATITGIRPLGIGYISVIRNGDPLNATSSLNIKDGLNLANTTTFVTDDDGEFCLFSSSNTDATLDIISYEAAPDTEFVNQRIFDTRRPPLAEPRLGPIDPVFVSGDRSLIGRVSVDCTFGRLSSGGVIEPITNFKVTVDGIPRTEPVGADGIFNEIVYEIDLYAPPLYARGQGSSRIDSNDISASAYALGQQKYMRGTVTVLASAGSGDIGVNIFGTGVDGGTTFDIPGLACHER